MNSLINEMMEIFQVYSTSELLRVLGVVFVPMLTIGMLGYITVRDKRMIYAGLPTGLLLTAIYSLTTYGIITGFGVKSISFDNFSTLFISAVPVFMSFLIYLSHYKSISSSSEFDIDYVNRSHFYSTVNVVSINTLIMLSIIIFVSDLLIVSILISLITVFFSCFGVHFILRSILRDQNSK